MFSNINCDHPYYKLIQTLKTAIQYPDYSNAMENCQWIWLFSSRFHLNLSIKTASPQTLNPPLLQIFKHNITHKLIGSSGDCQHKKQRNKNTSALQYLHSSHKISSNPVYNSKCVLLAFKHGTSSKWFHISWQFQQPSNQPIKHLLYEI